MTNPCHQKSGILSNAESWHGLFDAQIGQTTVKTDIEDPGINSHRSTVPGTWDFEHWNHHKILHCNDGENLCMHVDPQQLSGFGLCLNVILFKLTDSLKYTFMTFANREQQET